MKSEELYKKLSDMQVDRDVTDVSIVYQLPLSKALYNGDGWVDSQIVKYLCLKYHCGFVQWADRYNNFFLYFCIIGEPANICSVVANAVGNGVYLEEYEWRDDI